jgi:serine/threonine-protein kinase
VGSSLDVTQLAAGTVLMDKYRVVETVGVGGMGVVIACDHLTLDLRVALKLLLPQLISNDAVVRRFVLEAKAATRIQSQHVARVLDVGTMTGEGLPEGGVPFMVMEYLEGNDLSHWVRRGTRFPIEDAVDYIAQAGEALAQAHKVGIIHRDIKPANLFLCEREGHRVVKVLDFGISKILDEEPQEMGLTKTTTVLGSGLYMSPEQMRSAKNVDFRTDIYSLGVCLYELLTGTQPHTAETFSELCVKVNIDPPTPLRRYRSDAPSALARVLEKAYARDPADRHNTVQDFVAALEPFASRDTASTIKHVRGITTHRERTSMAPPALGTTSAGTVAAAAHGEEGRSRLGMTITAAIAALVLAAGVGVFMSQRGGGQASGGEVESATPPPPSVPVTTASASSPPTPEPSEEPSAEPPTAVSTAAASSPPKPSPARPPAPRPPPPPQKLCNRFNPEKGMMDLVPCD